MENNLNHLVAENSILKDALFGKLGVVSGLEIIEKCLSTAKNANQAEAPFPLNETEAKLWHRAQAEAFQHVLEMISISPEVLRYSGKPLKQSTISGQTQDSKKR